MADSKWQMAYRVSRNNGIRNTKYASRHSPFAISDTPFAISPHRAAA